MVTKLQQSLLSMNKSRLEFQAFLTLGTLGREGVGNSSCLMYISNPVKGIPWSFPHFIDHIFNFPFLIYRSVANKQRKVFSTTTQNKWSSVYAQHWLLFPDSFLSNLQAFNCGIFTCTCKMGPAFLSQCPSQYQSLSFELFLSDHLPG